MTNEVVPAESGAVISASTDDLSRVVKKALQQIEDILDQDMEGLTIEMQMKLFSIKKDAATGIINAGLKADENRFRRENKDIVERLFDKIRKESKIIEGRVTNRS